MVYNYNCDILNEFMDKKKKRILVIRCGRLGDTAISTVILDPLRHIYKNVEIDWVTKTEVADIFACENDVNPIRFKHTKIPLLMDINKIRIIMKSLFNPYDAIFNLEVSKKYDYLVMFTRALKKFGRPYHHIPDDRTEHRAKHQLRIINKSSADYPAQNAIPNIKCKPLNVLSNFFDVNKEFIVISPSTSKVGKNNHRGYRNWSLENWKILIGLLIEKTDFNIVLTGTNKDYNGFSNLHTQNKRVNNLAGKLSLSEYATTMKFAKYVIGVDSASVHVASAVGSKKIIAIYGPTNIHSSRPYETKFNQVQVISKSLPCSPCYGTSVIENCKDNICMKKIMPSDVFNIIKVK